jgi:signal transduction histidine kinase/PAS domain-containing protein/ActR/RegA family two-component response regulator
MTELTEEQLKGYAAFSPVDTAIYRVRGGKLETLFLSENIPDLLGMTREEYLKITEKDAMDLTLPQDRKGLAAATGACIATGKKLDYYYRVYSDKKGFDWVHVDAHTCGSMDGDTIIIARFANVSREGGIYETILDNSDRITVVLDRHTMQMLYANDKLFSTKKIKEADLLNRTCYSILFGLSKPCEKCPCLHPDDDTKIHEEYVFDEKEATWSLITSRNVTWCMQDAVIIYIKDVTEEKKAETSLNRLNQMYSMAIEDAKQMLWDYDPQTKTVRYRMENPYTKAVCEKMGMPAVVENVPESILGIIDPPYRDRFVKLFDWDGMDPKGISCEYSSTFHGETQWWKVTSRPVYDLNHELKMINCSAMNLTDEKQAEANYRSLLTQVSQLKNLGAIAGFRLNLSRNRLISGSAIYSGVTDELQTETADLHFKAAAESIEDEQIKQKVLQEYTCAELLQKYRQGVRQVSVEYPVRSRMKASEGQIRWFRALNDLVLNPDTGDIEDFSSVIEITKQKKNERMLNFMASRGCDYIGLINVYERKAEVFDGIWKDSLIGDPEGLDYPETLKRLAAYVSPANREAFSRQLSMEAITEKLGAEDELLIHYDFIGRDSRTLKKQIKLKWFDDKKTEILMIQEDVTEAYVREQKRIAEMQDALHQAELANRAKTDFVSRISHDIRTPISAIISMTEFAKEDAADRDRLLGDIDKISASSQFLLSLINDILDISKIDSGKMELYPEYYPYREFVSSIRSIFEPMCQQKHIDFVVQENAPQYGGVIVDRVRYNQVALNIISNAVKYTPEGGRITYVSQSSLLPGGKVRCAYTVSDTGVGMSEEFQGRMFEAFTQENSMNRSSLAAKGTGLGLAIVKRIMDLMGGTISVKSSQGAGTSVSISVDLPAATAEQIAEYEKRKQAGTSSVGGLLKGKVLLAEDNEINTEIAVRMLRKLGLEVDSVENGTLAVEAFRKSAANEYLAILMDIQMPVLDGYSATERIRRLERPDAAAIPIIAMTADAFVESIEQSRRSGMDDYITKPIDLNKLEAILLRHARQGGR